MVQLLLSHQMCNFRSKSRWWPQRWCLVQNSWVSLVSSVPQMGKRRPAPTSANISQVPTPCGEMLCEYAACAVRGRLMQFWRRNLRTNCLNFMSCRIFQRCLVRIRSFIANRNVKFKPTMHCIMLCRRGTIVFISNPCGTRSIQDRHAEVTDCGPYTYDKCCAQSGWLEEVDLRKFLRCTMFGTTHTSGF